MFFYGFLEVLHLLMKCVSEAERMMKLPKYETKSTVDPILSNFLREFRTCKNMQKKILDNIAQHLNSKKDPINCPYHR